MRSTIELLRGKTLLALACVLSVGVSAPTRADESVRAVWQVQDIFFPYFGITTHYSCDGLRDRVRDVLKQLNVREDYIVSIAGCADIVGVERNASVSMVVANAVPATEEITKVFAADPKRAELLARLQRKSKTLANDAPFDAIPKQVTLHAKDKYNTGAAGDCELLEQMQRFVFPKLGVKIINDRVSCSPHQGSVGNPSLDVELLVAAQAP